MPALHPLWHTRASKPRASNRGLGVLLGGHVTEGPPRHVDIGGRQKLLLVLLVAPVILEVHRARRHLAMILREGLRRRGVVLRGVVVALDGHGHLVPLHGRKARLQDAQDLVVELRGAEPLRHEAEAVVGDVEPLCRVPDGGDGDRGGGVAHHGARVVGNLDEELHLLEHVGPHGLGRDGHDLVGDLERGDAAEVPVDGSEDGDLCALDGLHGAATLPQRLQVGEERAHPLAELAHDQEARHREQRSILRQPRNLGVARVARVDGRGTLEKAVQDQHRGAYGLARHLVALTHPEHNIHPVAARRSSRPRGVPLVQRPALPGELLDEPCRRGEVVPCLVLSGALYHLRQLRRGAAGHPPRALRILPLPLMIHPYARPHRPAPLASRASPRLKPRSAS
mmetsp:Transcript_39315/g.76961  ORF Transcript_39315/g.76961 Transcript_39315/m.76961 type:complete len:396 (-) Transcript_39315:400-1587(-)